MGSGSALTDKIQIVEAFAPGTPSSTTPDYISLKNVQELEVLIVADNGSTVTGSAVTLHQATAVAGTGVKALAFDRYYANIDTAAGDTLTEATATSNTFTTDTTNAKNLMYRIPVDVSTLDTANGFDCFRVGLGNAANTVIAAYYIITPKYGGNATNFKSAIVD